ncbi:MAG: RnfABCDGE type electron transport complex subunit G [Bacillota bacterium]|nr:RnfABCDGE type electron transport complex subunit G [Bacillota bacterium]
MKEIVKLGISLLIFCAVAALSLAFTNELTKDQIAKQRAEKELAAKQAVLPEANEFEDLSAEELAKVQETHPTVAQISVAKSDGQDIGFVVKTLPMGFGGPITVITGMDAEGKITGVRVAKHTESPGLGSKAQEPAYYEQYNGKSVADVKVTKGTPGEQEIVAISSATITSVAVTNGVNDAAVATTLGK